MLRQRSSHAGDLPHFEAAHAIRTHPTRRHEFTFVVERNCFSRSTPCLKEIAVSSCSRWRWVPVHWLPPTISGGSAGRYHAAWAMMYRPRRNIWKTIPAESPETRWFLRPPSTKRRSRPRPAAGREKSQHVDFRSQLTLRARICTSTQAARGKCIGTIPPNGPMSSTDIARWRCSIRKASSRSSISVPGTSGISQRGMATLSRRLAPSRATPFSPSMTGSTPNMARSASAIG